MASAPGDDKASKRGVAACDGPGLLALLDCLHQRAGQRCRCPVTVVVMQEAGRDGFWVHRLLEAHGVWSVVVNPSSIAVNRHSRRAKTDRIDAEAMLRTLMAWRAGSGRCARWCGRPRARRRMPVGSTASGRPCWLSASGTPTGSRGCSRRRACSASSHVARAAGTVGCGAHTGESGIAAPACCRDPTPGGPVPTRHVRQTSRFDAAACGRKGGARCRACGRARGQLCL